MSGVTVTSPTPRRIATPSWLDLRLVLGVVLVLGSVLAGALIVSRAGRTHGLVTATHDLAAGTIVHGDDVRVTQVQVPSRGRGVYLASVQDVVGKTLGRAVSKGELVPAAAVTQAPARTTLTVPFEAGAAPDLHAGQRIEIWVSSASCSSVVLLRDVTVQAVHADTGGSFTTGTGGQDVVISVARPLAGRIVTALAIDQAQIRAGVLVGGPDPSSAEAGDLPDLTPCTQPSGSR